MSDFVILGDVHIGARSANSQVMEHQLQYFENIFFPYLKTNNIKTILQLGDVFDTRKFSNHLVLHHWKKRFFDYMLKENIHFITILGNHDIAFKNTLEVNSVTLFLKEYKNIFIVDKPTEYTIEEVPFLLLPWICEDNRDDIFDAVDKSNSVYCAGHFEFAGFEMNAGYMMTEGDDPTDFEKFDCVFSGHYHTKSNKDNIQYVGTPYEMTWIDYNDPKGFHVFNTKTSKITYINNTNYFFTKLYYDDKDKDDEYYKNIDCSCVPKSYVKLIVTNKNNPAMFEKFISKISNLEPIDLSVLDILDDFSDIELDEDIKTVDTIELIENFVDQIDTELEKEKILTLMKNLYVVSLNKE